MAKFSSNLKITHGGSRLANGPIKVLKIIHRENMRCVFIRQLRRDRRPARGDTTVDGEHSAGDPRRLF